MNAVLACAKLPLKLMDVSITQKEVLENINHEKPHFNTLHYTGEWTAVALRSPGGLADTILPDATGNEAFADTPLMLSCKSIKQLVDAFKCPVMAVRLLNLKSGAVIKEHRDVELAFENGEARLHFPIFTNPQVEFVVAGSRVDMAEGTCWYINANLPHSVANFGDTDRIHLVIDCQVNDWLSRMFDAAEVKIIAPDANDQHQLKMMISELRKQKTETSNQIANELETKLYLKNG